MLGLVHGQSCPERPCVQVGPNTRLLAEKKKQLELEREWIQLQDKELDAVRQKLEAVQLVRDCIYTHQTCLSLTADTYSAKCCGCGNKELLTVSKFLCKMHTPCHFQLYHQETHSLN